MAEQKQRSRMWDEPSVFGLYANKAVGAAFDCSVDPKPFKVYSTWLPQPANRSSVFAEYATEQEAFDHQRRSNWHYAFYHEHKKI